MQISHLNESGLSIVARLSPAFDTDIAMTEVDATGLYQATVAQGTYGVFVDGETIMLELITPDRSVVGGASAGAFAYLGDVLRVQFFSESDETDFTSDAITYGLTRIRNGSSDTPPESIATIEATEKSLIAGFTPAGTWQEGDMAVITATVAGDTASRVVTVYKQPPSLLDFVTVDTGETSAVDGSVAALSRGATVINPEALIGQQCKPKGLLSLYQFEERTITIPVVDYEGDPVDMNGVPIRLVVHNNAAPIPVGIIEIDSTGEGSSAVFDFTTSHTLNQFKGFATIWRTDTNSVLAQSRFEIAPALNTLP